MKSCIMPCFEQLGSREARFWSIIQKITIISWKRMHCHQENSIAIIPLIYAGYQWNHPNYWLGQDCGTLFKSMAWLQFIRNVWHIKLYPSTEYRKFYANIFHELDGLNWYFDGSEFIFLWPVKEVGVFPIVPNSIEAVEGWQKCHWYERFDKPIRYPSALQVHCNTSASIDF